MALLPKVKLKALPSFPASTTSGPGIQIDKASGNYTVSLNVSNFQVDSLTIAASENFYAVSWGHVTTDNPNGEFGLVPYSSLQNNLTGDVTSVASVTTIGAHKVTRGMEAQGVARSVIGVTGNVTADVADIQGTASQFLGVNSAGTALAFQTMTGDVTLSGAASTIASNVVTNAKLAQAGAATLKGNVTSGTANVTDFTIQGLTSLAAPSPTLDLVLIYDHVSGTLKSATPSSIGSAASVSSIAGNTGAFTLSNGVTNSVNDVRLDVGNLPGVTTNSNAAAGKLGEFITAQRVRASALSLTTNVAANVTSISLTAGDWDVFGVAGFSGTATSSSIVGGSSTTTATLPGLDSGQEFALPGLNVATQDAAIPIPTQRFSLSGTTTVFLVSLATFGAGTTTAYGTISARRVR